MNHVLIFSGGLLVLCLAMAYIIFANKEDAANTLDNKLIHFGAVILTGIGLIFSLAMAMAFFEEASSTRGKEIFDSVKTILPPVVTLILGYYFGKKQDAK